MVQGRGPDLRGAGDPLSDLSEDASRDAPFVIFNPASGRGRGGRRIQRYRELILQHFPRAEFGITEFAGHEYRLADEAIERGFTRIVAVGGDGTWSHVADRIASSRREGLSLGLLPSGTGNDFGRNLGLSYGDPRDAVERLARGRPVPVDIGRVNTPSRAVRADRRASREARPRHFLNVVGVGFDVAVVEAAEGARFLRGELLYKVTALQQLFRFRGLPISVARDGQEPASRDHLMLTVTNGMYFGGGFPIVPGARVDDGLLHACLIGNASPLRRMALFNRAEKGRHTDQPEVEFLQAPRYSLGFQEAPRFEADGDLFDAEAPELSVEVLPGGIRVIRD